MKKHNSAERLWTPGFFLLLLITLFSGAAGQMTVPLVSEYALSIGADLTLASAISGLMSMVSLAVCPFAGALADRISRKRILIVANFGYGICLILHACSSTVSMLIVMRLLTGLFFSVCTVTNVAFSSGFIPRERMGEGLGYVALASVVAQAFGPSAGIWLLDLYGHGVSFIAAGISCLICMGIIFIMPYQQEKIPGKEKRPVRLKDLYAAEFTGFMLMAFLFSAGNGLVSTYLKLIAGERAIANISLFFTAYSLFMVILRPLVGKVMDTRGIYAILIPAFLCAGAGMFLIGIGMSLGMMIIASAFKALGQGSGTPSLQAHCVKSLDKERAGVATSTIMIGQNVGNALAPIMGSYLVLAAGYRAMMCSAGLVIAVLGLVLVAIQYKAERKSESVV